jgi:hypothetical protein
MTGNVVRTWTGDTWTGVMDPPAQTVVLAPEPLAVSGDIADAAMTGRISIKDGQLMESSGTLTFTMRLAALTQPVDQRHRIAWSLVRE